MKGRKFWLSMFLASVLSLSAFGAGMREKQRFNEKGNIFELAVRTRDFRDNLYLYLNNSTGKPLEIEEIYVDGKDVKELTLRGQDIKYNETKKGVIRWYDIVPHPIPAGSWALLRIRYGDRGMVGEKVKVKIISKDGRVYKKEMGVVTEPKIKYTSYSFSEDRRKLYLYLEKESQVILKKVLLNGKAVPFRTKEIKLDDMIKTVVFCTLSFPEPFPLGEHQIVKIVAEEDKKIVEAACLIKGMAPFFPIGPWVINYSTETVKDEEMLKDVARHLNNFGDPPLGAALEPSPDNYVPEMEELEQKCGIKMFIHPVNAGSLDQPTVPWVQELARRFSSGIAAWLLWDEPAISEGEDGNKPMFLLGWMKNFREDGGYAPVFVNHSPEVEAYYEYNFTDIMSFDCYPIPGNHWPHKPKLPREDRGTLSRIEEEMDAARKAVAPKPVWFVSQAFYGMGEDDFATWPRLPTPEEERLMVYQALSHGAKGIIYFSHFYEYFNRAEEYKDVIPAAKLLWAGIGDINLELRLLSKLLLRGEVVPLAEINKEKVEVATVISGEEAIVVFILNHNYDSTMEGSNFQVIKDIQVKVKLPQWFRARDIFRVSHKGIKGLDYQKEKRILSFSLNELKVSEVVVIAGNKTLFSRMDRERERLYSLSHRTK